MKESGIGNSASARFLDLESRVWNPELIVRNPESIDFYGIQDPFRHNLRVWNTDCGSCVEPGSTMWDPESTGWDLDFLK